MNDEHVFLITVVLIAIAFVCGVYAGIQTVDIPPWCGPSPPVCNCGLIP
jgi:hypothetical protein